MKWSELGKSIADFAPALGSVLGGPLGGGLGGIIANVFGTEEEPGAILAAIKADPAAAVKLQQIQSDERVKIQEAQAIQTASMLETINKTMREESKSEHWMQWAWRPLWGIISATAFFIVCGLVCYLAYLAVIGGKPEAMTMIPGLITSMTTLFAIPGAILGVASWHRGKQKRGV